MKYHYFSGRGMSAVNLAKFNRKIFALFLSFLTDDLSQTTENSSSVALIAVFYLTCIQVTCCVRGQQ